MLLFFKDAVIGVQTTLHVCYLEYAGLVNGGYYSNCKVSKMSRLACDENLRKRFMDYSLNLLKKRLDLCPDKLNEILKC